jgi:uncharacterized protein YbaP (TraB family)
MKRLISLFAAALLAGGIFFGILSCSSSSGSSVWAVSKNGHTLYLSGSVHELRAEDFPLPKEFDRAFSLAKVLILETDIEYMMSDDFLAYFMSRMALPEGQTLQSVLDPETYDLLEQKCAEYGLPVEAISSLKPAMAAMMLTELQAQNLGFEQEGVDMFYLKKALEANKPVGFLEAVEDQVAMLDSLSENANEYVRQTLQEMEAAEETLATMLAEWKKGIASFIETYLLKMKNEWPEVYTILVIDRNAAWLPQIEKYLAEGKVPFIVVGAAHLHGPDGLLTRLEKSGCLVEQLK